MTETTTTSPDLDALADAVIAALPEGFIPTGTHWWASPAARVSRIAARRLTRAQWIQVYRRVCAVIRQREAQAAEQAVPQTPGDYMVPTCDGVEHL